MATRQDVSREIQGAPRERTQIGVYFQNVNARELCQDVLRRILARSTRPPDSCLQDPAVDWGDYTRVSMASASYWNPGIEIYLHKCTVARGPWRVDLEFANTLGSVLHVKVYTHATPLYILAVHALQVRKVHSCSYHLCWMQLWQPVLACSDPGRLLMVGDINSAYQRAVRRHVRTTASSASSVKLGVHHLEELVTAPGTAVLTGTQSQPGPGFRQPWLECTQHGSSRTRSPWVSSGPRTSPCGPRGRTLGSQQYPKHPPLQLSEVRGPSGRKSGWSLWQNHSWRLTRTSSLLSLGRHARELPTCQPAPSTPGNPRSLMSNSTRPLPTSWR